MKTGVSFASVLTLDVTQHILVKDWKQEEPLSV